MSKTQSSKEISTRNVREITTFSETSKRVEQYVPLSFRVARKYPSKYLAFDERQQIALIGIAKALETFNPRKSTELAWVYQKACFALRDAVRSAKRKHESETCVYLSDYESERAECYLLQVEAPQEETQESENNYKLLYSALKRLDRRTAGIVYLVGLQGVSQKEAAKKYGISQSWCSRVYNRGLNELRQLMSSES